jgi:hypothetical protein
MRHMFDIRTHKLAVVNAKPSKELVSVMAKQQTIPKQSHEQAWPAEGLTRVPYRVFQTEECDSAWKKDPLGGVIGVQKGPL